jgi:hypothetical protein
MMWTRYFLEERGYGVEDCILNQDNMSAMLLETNGKQSSSKQTKHIRVRYFFIKDRVSNGDITLKHCPTGEMLADHFTKPLQGALFQKFRAEIQSIPPDINEAELGWDRGEKSEQIKHADPGPQECLGPRLHTYPRLRNPGLRSKYLIALRSKVGQADSAESALVHCTTSTAHALTGVYRDEGVSYAQILRGEREEK